MDSFTRWSLGIAASAIVVWAVWLLTPLSRRRSLDRWVRKQSLPLRPQDALALEKWWWDIRAASVAGMLIGLSLGVVLCLALLPRLESFSLLSSLLFVVLTLPALVGESLGPVASAGRLSALAPETSRAAHSSASRLVDYISPPRLVLIRATSALVLLLGLVWAAAAPWSGSAFGDEGAGPLWVVLGVQVTGWLVVELAANRLVARPQLATDPLELAWQDARRAEVLSSVLYVAELLAFETSLVLSMVRPHIHTLLLRRGGTFLLFSPGCLVLLVQVVTIVERKLGESDRSRLRRGTIVADPGTSMHP